MDQLEVSPCPTLEEVRKQLEVWRKANKPRSPMLCHGVGPRYLLKISSLSCQ